MLHTREKKSTRWTKRTKKSAGERDRLQLVYVLIGKGKREGFHKRITPRKRVGDTLRVRKTSDGRSTGDI